MFRAKKAKVQTESSPTIEGAESISNASRIINSFTTAFKCYELMHSTADLQTGRGCGLINIMMLHIISSIYMYMYRNFVTSNAHIIQVLYYKARYMYMN